MNGLEQFISSLVQSLAWPGAAVAMVFAFRRPLSRILSSRPVKIFKAGPQGLEVEFFDEKLQEAQAELSEAIASQPAEPSTPSPLPGGAESDFVTEMQQLAEVSPPAAVMASFARLERVLRDAVVSVDGEGAGGRPTRFLSARALARKAREQGLISQPELAAFDDVAVLRNVVAHGDNADLDKERALAYVDLVRQMIISIAIGTGRTVLDGPVA